MSSLWTPSDLQALSDIFAQAAPSSAGEEAFPAAAESSSSRLAPSSIGPASEAKKKKTAIEAAIQAAEHDSRVQPEYEFVYKQAVTPNDVYLQLSEKTPSTIFCEELVMKIKLPDTESCNDLKLDVKPTYLKLTSPNYYLAMYLPHKVNDTRSCAKWDALTSTLSITMPIEDRNILE